MENIPLCFPHPLPDYHAARNYLYALKHHGARYGIDRMLLLTEALGHPQRRFPIIHVAGTNGKGSTSAMLEAIYRQAGYTTGLYTSPHLVHQGERVQVNRTLLSHEEIVDFTNRLRPVAEELEARDPGSHPSFFEFMTAMAFLRFAAAQVGMAIVEVGLGGRLDATNVVLPELSIVTSISLDHCETLGGTIELIAAEKAGIVKTGRPVVLGRMPAAAEAVIREVAARHGSPVHSIAEHFGPDWRQYPMTRLEGAYQRCNAATATLAARLLRDRYSVSEAHIETALRAVKWEGRWERRTLADGRPIILDASHNPEGAEQLDAHLQALAQETGRPPVVITGSLGERRADALFSVIARHAAAIHLIRPAQPRALPYDVMESLVPASYSGPIHRSKVRDLFPSPGVCTVGHRDQTVVITGSIYLIGEVMEALDYPHAVSESILQD